MCQYELIYFPGRGRGQAIRYLLKDNGIAYKETSVTPDKWPSYKPKMPFGQVPMLVDGDLELVQSNTIMRYLGRKHGMYPDDFKASARVDMVNDHVEDIRGGYVKLIYTNYDAGKEEYVKSIGSKLQPIEKLLKAWGNDYITAKISYADYNLFDLLDIHEVLAPGCTKGLPTVKAFYDRMAARPGLKKYRATDECKNMPINGNGKQ